MNGHGAFFSKNSWIIQIFSAHIIFWISTLLFGDPLVAAYGKDYLIPWLQRDSLIEVYPQWVSLAVIVSMLLSVSAFMTSLHIKKFNCIIISIGSPVCMFMAFQFVFKHIILSDAR